MSTNPLIWSIAGNDSGGGAGLSADARAAAAFGVHLCPVVAAITVQNSQSVAQVFAVDSATLRAQLLHLAEDMPPAVIKTGMLGSADNVRVVAEVVALLRQRYPQLQLVVDPVLGASTGRSFANPAILQAYAQELLPRANLITPNTREAAQLVQLLPTQADATMAADPVQFPRANGLQTACITGGDATAEDEADASAADWALDWLQSPQAVGWLGLPRIATAHNHGTGCTFATSAAAALALGFCAADACILAKMATTHALAHGYAAGSGAGPVQAQAGFTPGAVPLPVLSWGDAWHPPTASTAQARALPKGIYAIVASITELAHVLKAGATIVQLRQKTPPDAGGEFAQQLQHDIAQAVQLAKQYKATLFINDHWQAAWAAGVSAVGGVHLGQEDLGQLNPAERAALHSALAQGLQLGVSSHSLWELARARGMPASYIACGPVWPTTTKDMPWKAQGLHNLRYWVQTAGKPVVAIGGILEPAQAQACAAAGAHAVCLVRGLGSNPAKTLPAFQQAFTAGHKNAQKMAAPAPSLPQPTL